MTPNQKELDKVIILKAEIFDLQIRITTDRKNYQDKIKELNGLLQEGDKDEH